jgi:ferredoxin
MKVRVLGDRCQGHALCEMEAPEFFDFDDSGYNATRVKDVPADRVEQIRRAVACCPERALHAEEQ